jgi:hypothetical protein
MYFVERNKLIRVGITYIDAHLLVSTALADTPVIWTRDKRLQKFAGKQKLAFD